MSKVGDHRPGASLGRALLVVPLILLASCGGGSGSISRQAAARSQAAPNPPAPATQSRSITAAETVRPLQSTAKPQSITTAETANQPQQNDPCFTTAGGACLSQNELTARAQKLAAAFKADYHQTFKAVWGDNANKAYWGLDMINYDKALAHLQLARGRGAAKKPGGGVIIGFIDSGINKQHEAFALKSKNSVVKRFRNGAVNEDHQESSHGTAVASIAAGRYGLASSAKIKMFAIPLRSGTDYEPITLNQLAAKDYKDSQVLKNAFTNHNLDILNLSFGSQGTIDNYTEQDLRTHYRRTIRWLAQAKQQDKTILVWAAGNAGAYPDASSSSPEVLAGLVARISELQGHSLAVVSVDNNGLISNFSNRCGIAAEFCIAAPGGSMIVADKGNNIWSLKAGTSLAAPYVSGSLALLKQLFRGQLSNTQLVSRILTTANDDGVYANTSIYGHGLLDLGAASNPWGFTSFRSTHSQPAEPKSCKDNSIVTHPSLGFGCLTKDAFEQQVGTWAKDFGARKNFRSQWGLKAINADRAYAHLRLIRGKSEAPGEGVVIGFINSGIDQDHPHFSGSTIKETFHRTSTEEDGRWESYGTRQASVAVGRQASSSDSDGFHGVAWGADLAVFAAIPGFFLSTDPYTRDAYDQAHADGFAAGLAMGTDILNIGFNPSSPTHWTNYQELRRKFSRAIAVLAQANRPTKTILVWPAGVASSSYNRDSPHWWAGMPAHIPELRGHTVAVVATKQDGTIASYSPHCGIAANWCIAAPGENVRVATFGPRNGENGVRGWSVLSGTSLAAPYVSGSLAVMKQMFRDQLSNEQLVSRLFSTAKDDGIYANSAIYGHGLLDLGAATNPWGVPGLMGTQSSATDTGASISTSFMSLGAPLGDSLPQALASQEIAAFDSLGAPFWYPASHFTVPASGTSLATNLQRFLNPAEQSPLPDVWQFSFQEDATAIEGGHLALSHGASRFSMRGPQGWGATLFQEAGALEGLSVTWNPLTFDDLTIEAGYLKEKQSLLGTQASGAFGQLSADTLFFRAGINTTAGRWQLATQGELGHVIPSVGHSLLIDRVSSLTTSAFGLEATRPFDNGSSFSFSLRQPLRVEQGTATFSLPIGRSQDGVVLGKTLSAPLAPRGRQLDLTAKLEIPLWRGDVSMGATRSQHPQHQLGAAPQWTVFTGYRSSW